MVHDDVLAWIHFIMHRICQY